MNSRSAAAGASGVPERSMMNPPAVAPGHRDGQEVAAVRMEAAKDPDDPELAVLVGELAVQDPDFRTWWATHQVAGTHYGTKHYRHPVVGDLTLDCDTWNSPGGTGQRLMILNAEPGTPHTTGCASLPRRSS